jgi:hypothetical protein
MKINAEQLRKIILKEMRMMRREPSHGHHEVMDVVMQAAGGCPIKARAMLQSMLSRIEPMAHEREMQLHHSLPNPATSGEIPPGERLMGDEVHMAEKKVTSVKGPGHSRGILGPGFR